MPPILVFVQSIERATSLFHELIYDALPIEVIHSERTPKERERVLRDFREGKVWVLICTELIGRGMDFRGVRAVVNYDFPTSVQSYVHRIGASQAAVGPFSMRQTDMSPTAQVAPVVPARRARP